LRRPIQNETRPLARLAILIVAFLILQASAGGLRAAQEAPPAGSFFIREYLVEGVHSLRREAVEEAVYPYLGPERTKADVESARAAVEKAYHDAGFQTVSVEIPAQPTSQIIRLKVIERTVAKLRVRGAKYTSPKRIKALAPSMAEGKVINFNDVPKDIVALNQNPDSVVTPSLKADPAPDKVDVDLNVKDTSPVHASIELDNRQAPYTDALRLNGSVSTSDLAHTGQGLGFSFQTSPQDTSQVRVFSGYYIARFAGIPGFSLMLQGTDQDSNVSTLGDTAVAGKGKTAGLRALFNLPSSAGFVQSANFGIDFKHFDQTVSPGGASDTTGAVVTPITYYPLDAGYSATWSGKHATTELNAGVTANILGLGSTTGQFDQNRYGATGSFIYFKGDLTQTEELPLGMQVAGKIQGQISNEPLVAQEQITGGGLGTVRGYLEADVVGDNGLFGSIELRSPSLLSLAGKTKGDFRVFAFYDAGWLTVVDPLAGQDDHFDLASYGVGAHLRIADHFTGSFDAAVPLIEQGQTKVDRLRLLFQAALDY
jgi:hemolysin activation/secretion protein